MKKRQIPNIFMYGLSFFVFIAIWHFLSISINAPLILPTPLQVAKSFVVFVQTKIFWQSFASTAFRCFISFVLSLFAGTIIGCICGLSKNFSSFMSFPLAAIRSTPVVSIILVSYFWFKSTHVPIFVSTLMTFPVVVTAVSSGFVKVDKKLLDMAQVYGFSKRQRIKLIFMPSILPYFLTGAVSSFGMTWKVVAAGEVLVLPKISIGQMMYTAQVHLETQQLLALTFMLVVFSFILETLFAFCVKAFNKRRSI